MYVTYHLNIIYIYIYAALNTTHRYILHRLCVGYKLYEFSVLGSLNIPAFCDNQPINIRQCRSSDLMRTCPNLKIIPSHHEPQHKLLCQAAHFSETSHRIRRHGQMPPT